MKKLILTLNTLPSSGKTTFSRIASQYYIKEESNFEVLHTAEEDLPGDASFLSARLWNLDEDLTLQNLIHEIENNDIVILDVRSEDAAEVMEFFLEGEVLDYIEELEAELVIVAPVNGNTQSHHSLLELAEGFSANAEYLIPQLFTNKDEQWEWKQSLSARAMKHLHAKEISVPIPSKKLNSYMEKSGEMLSELLDEEHSIPKNIQQDLINWRKNYLQELSKVEALLLPEEKPRTSLKSFYGKDKKIAAVA